MLPFPGNFRYQKQHEAFKNENGMKRPAASKKIRQHATINYRVNQTSLSAQVKSKNSAEGTIETPMTERIVSTKEKRVGSQYDQSTSCIYISLLMSSASTRPICSNMPCIHRNHRKQYHHLVECFFPTCQY